MTKLRAARLSLTIPGSLDMQDDRFGSERKDSQDKPGTSTFPETGSDLGSHGSPRRQEDEALTPTDSPPTQSMRSFQSPVSPNSPAFTSLPPVPLSPNAMGDQVRSNAKSFLSNIKATKPTTKAQPRESTIRKVQEGTLQNDTSVLPSRTKSTPDLRSTSSSDPIPDLPCLDGSQPSCELLHPITFAEANSIMQLWEALTTNTRASTATLMAKHLP